MRNLFSVLTSAIAAAFVLTACAPTGNPTSDPSSSTRLKLPQSCQLEPDEEGSVCTVSRGHNTAVILFFDDVFRRFDANFPMPIELMARKHDAESRAFWYGALEAMVLNDVSRGVHNDSSITSWDFTPLSATDLPPGTDACVRTNWSGRLTIQDTTVKSRQYMCVGWRPQDGAFRLVSLEVGTVTGPGADAPGADYREVADTVFASLALSGS